MLKNRLKSWKKPLKPRFRFQLTDFGGYTFGKEKNIQQASTNIMKIRILTDESIAKKRGFRVLEILKDPSGTVAQAKISAAIFSGVFEIPYLFSDCYSKNEYFSACGKG